MTVVVNLWSISSLLFVSHPDVRACDEAEEVPLHWELLICPQS